MAAPLLKALHRWAHNRVRQILLPSAFYTLGDFSTERLSNFPKNTQLVNGRAGIWAQSIYTKPQSHAGLDDPDGTLTQCLQILSWQRQQFHCSYFNSSRLWGTPSLCCYQIPEATFLTLDWQFEFFFDDSADSALMFSLTQSSASRSVFCRVLVLWGALQKKKGAVAKSTRDWTNVKFPCCFVKGFAEPLHADGQCDSPGGWGRASMVSSTSHPALQSCFNPSPVLIS